MKGYQLFCFKSPFFQILLPIALILLSSAVVCPQTPAQPASSPGSDSNSVTATPNAPVTTSATPAVSNETGVTANSDAPAVQERIERARALAAAHRLDIAASELEAVRRSTQDEAVRNITSVMLMGIYLEEAKYVLAQALLDENFRLRALGKDAALRTYFAIAGQAVIGARSHLARYRSFGINVSDSDLPAEAVNDLERLRALLEQMVIQARQVAGERKAYDALALLEDVLGVRLSLARDVGDRAKWEAEYTGAREGLASSQTQIASLVAEPSMQRYRNQPGAGVTQPSKEPPGAAKEPPLTEAPLSGNTSPPSNAGATPPREAGEKSDAKTISTGLLNARASKRVVPLYPPLAKSSGTTGIVKVYVTIDEDGKVIAVTSSEGPLLLRPAAEEASRAWRFIPTAVDGKAVRVNGYIEFNFTL